MQQTLDKIRGENEKAAIKIGDIIDVSNKLKKNLSVISLDFLKTFDRVDWDYIFSALKKFEYGDDFIHMINIAYNNIQSRMKINGLLCNPFTLMGSVC